MITDGRKELTSKTPPTSKYVIEYKNRKEDELLDPFFYRKLLLVCVAKTDRRLHKQYGKDIRVLQDGVLIPFRKIMERAHCEFCAMNFTKQILKITECLLNGRISFSEDSSLLYRFPGRRVKNNKMAE